MPAVIGPSVTPSMEFKNVTKSPGDAPDQSTTGVSVGIIGAILLVLVIIVVCVIKLRQRRRRNSCSATDTEVGDDDVFLSDIELNKGTETQDKGATSTVPKLLTSTDYWCQLDDQLKQNVSDVIVDARSLTLGKILGQGEFGCVYEGTLSRDNRTSNDYGPLTHDRVAVKTLRGNNVDRDTIESFLKEGMIMKDFHHNNVLCLIGVSVNDQGIPMILLPFMFYGSLKKYLADPDLQITARELLEFGRQVAKGMNYLADHKFVHRDLATRNCMLDETLTVKVADFGLSRDIYDKEYYRVEDRAARLPVKWMAIESLTNAVFTSKSDVWAFGVLLWELMTRGATPYPDVCNWDIRSYVRAGRRMHQPDSCPDDVYDLMLTCWHECPNDRPGFAYIIHVISDILEQAAAACPLEEADHNYINLFLSVEVPKSQSDNPDTPSVAVQEAENGKPDS